MKDKKQEAQGATLWKQLTNTRTNYIDRARDASLLTIPQLYPPEGSDEGTAYPTPYQSLGAKGVNNLANKIALSLFPPNQAFFKLGLSPADMQAISRPEGDVKEAMYILERSIINEMEVSAFRPKVVHLLKQLIVGGSSVIYVPKVGQPEVFKLESFGIKRDKQGNVLKLVIRQAISWLSLDKDVQDQLEDISESHKNGDKSLDMYTCVVKQPSGRYKVWQEIETQIIEGTDGDYLKDDLPYLFVPFVDSGEDYGRSYIEDFIGDLQSYEGLRQSLLEGAAESARIIYLVKPNATVKINKLQKARSGDVLAGELSDIGVLQADKRMDMQVTKAESDALRQELAMTFLLNSAVRRDAERVTAEEIRQVSQELEVSLGGIYSTLAANLQAPLVKIYMNRLVAQKKLSPVIKDAAQLEITTGSAALGRGADFTTLTTFVGTINQIAQSPIVQSYVNLEELIKRIAYSLDINTATLVVSEEQRQQMQAAAQQASIQAQAAPKIMEQQAKSQLEQE